MTKTGRIEAARAFVCPKCHCEAGAKCKSQAGNNLSSGRYPPSPRKLMQGVHAERLALVRDGGTS